MQSQRIVSNRYLLGILETHQINSLYKNSMSVLRFTASRKNTQFGLPFEASVWNTAHFCVNSPVSRGQNSKQTKASFQQSNDGGEAASVYLSFRPRDSGVLTEKYGRFQTETSKRSTNWVFFRGAAKFSPRLAPFLKLIRWFRRCAANFLLYAKHVSN